MNKNITIFILLGIISGLIIALIIQSKSIRELENINYKYYNENATLTEQRNYWYNEYKEMQFLYISEKN